MSALSPTQQQILTAALREGETVLHAAPCGSGTPVAAPKSSFWARLLGKKARPVTAGAGADFFTITAKRVLLFNAASSTPREWFLMLGMIQDFTLHADGSGSIVFEYNLAEDGTRSPIGLLGIADAQQVHTLLASAIDAAYNASPWSV